MTWVGSKVERMAVAKEHLKRGKKRRTKTKQKKRIKIKERNWRKNVLPLG
jgi:hypothetical protein